jgi:hypothetical protein
MAPLPRRYEELLIRVLPARSGGRRASPQSTSEYDALLYTRLEPGITYRSRECPSGQPTQVGGLPFVGAERITVRWSHYEEYLQFFHDAEKAPLAMRQRLFETLSEGLQALFSGRWSIPAATRLWWSNECSELEDLPWELLTSEHLSTARISFVRGLPPEETPPLVPLRDEMLRLAIIGPRSAAPEELQRALDAPVSYFSASWFPGEPRKAIERAVEEGYELVHIIADGLISLGLEGILQIGEHRLSPRQLRLAVNNTRVTLITLSPPAEPRLDAGTPTVYRAFAHLGSGGRCSATMLAPVGPMPSWRMEGFWRQFYAGLAETLSIEDALLHCQTPGPPVPVAVFLRHRLVRQFSRRALAQSFAAFESTASTPDPTLIQAELKASRRLLQQLEAIDSKFAGLEGGVTRSDVLERERGRQQELERSLKPWLEQEEE